MIDSKVILTLAGLVATVCAINSINDNKKRENFGMLPSFDVKVDRLVAPNANAAKNGKLTPIQNNYRSMLNPNTPFYTVPGTFQSEIAPRFFAGDYGANITYNLPSAQNLAVPNSPLDYANVVGGTKENFCSSGNCGLADAGKGPVSCAAGGNAPSYASAPIMSPNYTNGNYKEMLTAAQHKPGNLKALHGNLPVASMETVNALGQNEQPIVYDRYMFANRNSRLRSLGDKIRGDLPIAPANGSEWFRPSVQPNIDLEQGAMNVIGGNSNNTNQQLADLIYTTSGNTKTTIGGSNLKHLGNPAQSTHFDLRVNRNDTKLLNQLNMQNNYQTNLSAGNSDIQVSTFP